MADGGADPARQPSVFDKLAQKADETVQTPFKALGVWAAVNPKTVMGLALLGALVCGSGMSQFTTENRPDKLWIPQGTDSKADEKKYERYFPRTGGVAMFIAEAKGSNLLTADALGDILTLHHQIYNISVKVSGERLTLEDLCVESGDSDDPCFMTNLLDAWDYKEGKLANDDDLLGTLNSAYSSSALEDMLGDESFASNSANVSSAKAVKIQYYLKSDLEIVDNQYVNKKNDAWEEKFLDIVRKFTSDEVKVYRSATRSWSDEFGRVISGDGTLVTVALFLMIIYMSTNLGDRPCAKCPSLTTRVALACSSVFAILLALLASHGISSFLGFDYSPMHGVLPFVILGLGVDDSFVIVNALDQVPKSLPLADRMHIALGHAATSVTVTSLTDFVAFAISTSSALPALASFCMYAAWAILLLFILQVTFFASALVLDERRRLRQEADCCFCMKQNDSEEVDNSKPPRTCAAAATSASAPAAHQQHQHQRRRHTRAARSSSASQPAPWRVFRAVRVGPATCGWQGLVCSCSNCKASPTGTTTTTTQPESQRALTKNKLNEESKEMPTAPTATPVVEQAHAAPEPGKVSAFLRDAYGPMLLHPTVRVAVLVAFLALLAVCSWASSQLTVESNFRNFIPDNSYLLRTLDKDDEYFWDQGSVCYIVTEDVDYYAERDNLLDIKDDVSSNKLSPYLRDPDTTDTYKSWYEDFVSYAGTVGLNYTADEDSFYSAIRGWLNGAGAYYNSSVAWEDNVIVATRIETEFTRMGKYDDDRGLITDADKVVDAMSALRSYNYAVEAFPWSYNFLTWETYRIIEKELTQNLAFCLLAVLIITTVLIGHPACSSLVCFTVAMTIIDILGCMYFWDLVIDNVTVIQTVIAIGLCVDYAAHVGHCFMMKAGTREERVIAALSDVGAAVLNGGFSTFLAVMLLAGSKSYVFRVLFQQFFLTVVLGMAHGMILLPVLLSWLGPNCYASAEADPLPGFELVGTDKVEPKAEVIAGPAGEPAALGESGV